MSKHNRCIRTAETPFYNNMYWNTFTPWKLWKIGLSLNDLTFASLYTVELPVENKDAHSFGFCEISLWKSSGTLKVSVWFSRTRVVLHTSTCMLSCFLISPYMWDHHWRQELMARVKEGGHLEQSLPVTLPFWRQRRVCSSPGAGPVCLGLCSCDNHVQGHSG